VTGGPGRPSGRTRAPGPPQALGGARARGGQERPLGGGEFLVDGDVAGGDASLLQRSLALAERVKVASAMIGAGRLVEERDAVEQGAPQRGGAADELEVSGVKHDDGREGGEAREALRGAPSTR
jgi:hypothetical protein